MKTVEGTAGSVRMVAVVGEDPPTVPRSSAELCSSNPRGLGGRVVLSSARERGFFPVLRAWILVSVDTGGRGRT
jgi:hypothetical protein